MQRRTLIVFAIFAVMASNLAVAQLYRCPQKNGKVEFRDYPCELANRPAPPSPSLPSKVPSTAMVPPVNGPLTYETARRNCMQLLSQYDLGAPLKQCALGDRVCLQKANREMQAVYNQLIANPAWQANRCDIVIQTESSGEDEFVVVGAIRGCKYFVAEQNGSYSLLEDWLCFPPSRGDTGKGKINAYGLQELRLNGMKCTAYVDDWLLGRSRAAEKLAEKCQ